MNFEEGRNEALAQGVAYFVTEGFMKFGFVTVVHNAQPLGNLVIG